MTWTLLALPPVPVATVRNLFMGLDVEVLELQQRTQDAVNGLLPEADLVLGDWSPDLKLGDPGPRVSFVQLASSGINGVDPRVLADAGIPLANVPGGNAVSTAEWTVSATLNLLRKTIQADAAVRSGDWPQTDLRGQELAGKSVGVVGFGNVGSQVANLMEAFGCEVRFWARSEHPETRMTRGTFEAVAYNSDVVIVTLPLTPETRGLIDPSLMRPGSFLVNAGRGLVVQPDNLVSALSNGTLGGAALDVFPVEPLPLGSPLRSLPNVILSPHMAGVTVQATQRLLDSAATNLGRAVLGEPVRDIINGVGSIVRRR